MLKINSSIIYLGRNSSCSNRKGAVCSADNFGASKFIKPLTKDSFSRVNFEGYVPSAHNVGEIERICRLLKNLVESPLLDREPRFAIVSHSGHDADSLCSSVLFKRMIKEAFGADADVIVDKPVPKNFKPFHGRGEVRVVQEELGLSAGVEEIKKHFGDYDAVFCMDTAEKRLFHKGIYEGIVMPASNIVKIDHHFVDSVRAGDYNYGHMGLIDTSQKSTGHLLMQFVDALGVKKAGQKFRKMSDLIAATIHGDTNFLQYADAAAKRDMEELARTSDTQKVAEKLKRRTREHIIAINLLKGNTKQEMGGKVVYSVLDGTDFPEHVVRSSTGDFVDGLLGKKKPNVAFVVRRFPDGQVHAAIRSAEGHSAYDIAIELGGGGRLDASGIPFPPETPLEEAAGLILQQIKR